MSASIGNSNLTFGDGSSTSTAIVNWPVIASRPTSLSQFANDLGNYGGFIAQGAVNTTANCGFRANCSLQFYVYWNGTAIQMGASNCNCVCNC